MTQEERYRQVTAWFMEIMPNADTELHFETTFQLLVAVILSAQCTDKRVNSVTPALFAAYPDAESMAKATQESIFSYIRSISYPNNKAKHLLEMARCLVEEFQGKVPDTREELMRLPGVGRKTANVLLICAFHQAAMPVDTHVFRVSERIGLTQHSKSPEETEQILLMYFPKSLLALAHHWLILHGRYVCTARKPLCHSCGLTSCCRFFLENSQKAILSGKNK